MSDEPDLVKVKYRVASEWSYVQIDDGELRPILGAITSGNRILVIYPDGTREEFHASELEREVSVGE